MTLPPCSTLQNVIETWQFEPCQLNKLPTPAGAFHMTASNARSKVQTWPEFNRHALDNNDFNIVSKTLRISLMSFPGLKNILNIVYIYVGVEGHPHSNTHGWITDYW